MKKNEEPTPRFKVILMCLPIHAQHSLCSLRLGYALHNERKMSKKDGTLQLKNLGTL